MNPNAQPTRVESFEPPCTDPYVRWCGRGGAARLPPIPISGTFETCRQALRMSVYRGRPEVVDPWRFLRGYGRRGIGQGRGRCRKSRPERVRPALARLGLPVKRLTFLAVVIAEAFGMLAGRSGFALRFAGEAAVAAAVAVLDAVVDAGLPRRCRRGSVDRHQRHARNRNRRSQPVDSAQFHSPLVRSPSAYLGGGLSNSIIIFVSPTSAVARRARQHGQRRSPIFLASGFPRDDSFDAGEPEEGAGQS